LKISRIKEPWVWGFSKSLKELAVFMNDWQRTGSFIVDYLTGFFDLFRITVIYQSQLQIFENHGHVSELVIWFSWRTALRTSGY
jgi:hypothetical protein